ncbi:Ribose-5-phosphate isomerase A [Candidatus Gugararchaeum adminiculabundum]|nr:Ribose-5-phosphate isomerase A [Candidatus Gugararchaeum adminiculabundum]
MGNAKENAAAGALKYVKRNQVIGLGTGSTAVEFVRLLCAKNLSRPLNIKCVPTSLATEKQAREGGLVVVQLSEVDKIDVAIDGADSIDKESFFCIKGLGGALTREKVIAYNSKKFVLIADDSKVRPLNSTVIPVEVIPFAAPFVKRTLETKFSATSELRQKDGAIYVTDNGNHILDAKLEVNAANAKSLEKKINSIPGVVENGIFTRVHKVVIGTVDSSYEL